MPVPGLLTLSESFTSPPILTALVSDASSFRSGLVARDRTDASVRKLTLATLPISPSSSGITSIDTRASPPGAMTPSAQTSSAVMPPGFAPGTTGWPAPTGLAGGVVVMSVVP